MHSKNNNKTLTYIQGLRPFSDAIPKTFKKHLRKGGYNYSNVVDNWTRIVTKKISDSCYPITIKIGKNMKDGILILNVIHGKEMEVEYQKNEIMDKINSFFGYNLISNIKLKIINEKFDQSKNTLPKIKNFKRIEEKIKNINNDKLKSSLNNFIKAFNEKNK